jgi:hypothetical protein
MESVLFSRFYPIVESSLKQTRNVTAIRQVFNEILGRNNESLSSAVPDKAVWVDSRQEKKYFEILNINKEDIVNAIKDSSYISDEWLTIRNPMYISLILCIFYFNNNKKHDMVSLSMFMLSLYMYKNVRSKYFARTSENTSKVMNFTLSRLSKHHDLRVCGSIMKVIGKKNESYIGLWLNDRSGDVKGTVKDEIICKMVNDNHRRYETFFNNFYSEFKKDLVNGNYMNVDEDIDDGENFIESDNVSFTVERLTQKVVNRFILSTAPSHTLLKFASERGGCSINNLRTMHSYLINGHEKEFEMITRLILQGYLFEKRNQKEDIKTPDFVIEMLKYYKKQEVNNTNLVNLKSNVNKVFEESGLAAKVTRRASQDDCRRSIYLYIVTYIRDTM